MYALKSHRVGDLQMYTYDYEGICIQVNYYIDEGIINIVDAVQPVAGDDEINIDAFYIKCDGPIKFKSLATIIKGEIGSYST